MIITGLWSIEAVLGNLLFSFITGVLGVFASGGRFYMLDG
jgi:hypothetical protein